jgi:hypothetical protein
MKIDEKILKEISRYNFINNYLMEQAPPPPPLDAGAPPPPADAGAPPPPAGAGAPPPPAGPPPPAPVDVDADTDVELVDGDAEDQGGDTEELDITDLVDTQKTMADKQEEYFTSLFDQIKNMEEKLSEMDKLVSKIDSLETKFDKFRPKSPQEKLELRSLDSGPFKQNLADFFDEKKVEMEKSGKNEYVLTNDEVENFNPSDIESSFNQPMDDDDDTLLNRYNS